MKWEPSVPPVRPDCGMTVTIPARNEEGHILPALTALNAQTNPRLFDVILFANNCTDPTAAKARGFAEDHPELQLHVVEGRLPDRMNHVGYARKLVMDCAANRFLRDRNPFGIVATTDADTIVANDWIDQTFEAMRTADAVAGFVEIAPQERRAMPPAVQRLYEQENAFRLAWAELESLVDPLPEDPWPRHGGFVAASLAVSTQVYVRAGGLPPVPALEDTQFLHALRRVDARIRHSLRVRAYTSGRRMARVDGGFATLVAHLYRQAETGAPFLVEHPDEILRDVEWRVASRRLRRGESRYEDVALLSSAFGARPKRCEMVPVEDAIAGLRSALASRKAVSPTRSTTASGAG